MGLLTSSHTGEVIPAPCKRWRCPRCGPRRQRQFIKRISQRVAVGYFATFTVDRCGEVNSENVKLLNRHWRPLSRWLKRNARLRDTTWVNEIGPRGGRLHKHAVLTCDRFDYTEARAAVRRAGYGPVVKFIPIKYGQPGANAYVSKYLGKNLAASEWPKYARRCQTTIPAQPPEPGWQFSKLKLPAKRSELHEAIVNERIDRALFFENLRLEREAQSWHPQLDFLLTSTTDEKVRHTEGADHGLQPANQCLGPRGP